MTVADIERTVRDKLADRDGLAGLIFLDVADMDSVNRQFLVERQLISREHAESAGARSVAIDSDEQYSLMVNEEDHLRIQLMKSGLDLTGAWDQINAIDDAIEARLSYAIHGRLGYLDRLARPMLVRECESA